MTTAAHAPSDVPAWLEEVATELDAPRPSPEDVTLPSRSHPQLTLTDAYRVQQLVARRRTARGDAVVGRKVGLVDPRAQRALGTDEPICGRLYRSGVLPEGGGVPASELAGMRLECELAVVLERELVGPGITGAHVAAAVAGIAPAFEVIEDRLPDGAQVADMVADNCAGVGVVLGATLLPLSAVDRPATGVVLEVDGVTVGSGASGAVMGDPLRAVTWMVNRLATVGDGVAAGEVVLTGAMFPPVTLDGPARLRAGFGSGLGVVELTLEP
jgi:2-keto-4-pentenoate hydratase